MSRDNMDRMNPGVTSGQTKLNMTTETGVSRICDPKDSPRQMLAHGITVDDCRPLTAQRYGGIASATSGVPQVFYRDSTLPAAGHRRLAEEDLGIHNATSGAQRGARTHDPEIKSLVL
jgi:hypothetical protein